MTTAFVDTNILLYAVSAAPEDVDKKTISRKILERDDIGLSTQVLQEFYRVATKPHKLGFTHREAVDLIGLWKLYPIQAVALGVVEESLVICHKQRIGYWDAAIVAAARHLGCSTLYTENLSPGQVFDDILAWNPFADSI